jgi:hypothetical protein
MKKRDNPDYKAIINNIKSNKILRNDQARILFDADYEEVIFAQQIDQILGYSIDLEGASIKDSIFQEIVLNDVKQDFQSWYKSLIEEITSLKNRKLDNQKFMAQFPIKHKNGDIYTLIVEVFKRNLKFRIWEINARIVVEKVSMLRRFVFKIMILSDDEFYMDMRSRIYTKLLRAIRQNNQSYFYLTPAELDVVLFTKNGYSTRETAKRKISKKGTSTAPLTVYTQIKNIKSKARKIDNTISSRIDLLKFLEEGGELGFLLKN